MSIFCKITEEIIKPDSLYKRVAKAQNGAVATFCGVVRDHSADLRTDYLVYEAYIPMAEKKMIQIADEVVEKWDLQDIAILHRIGRLEIGEISVLIAVSSPHRKESFEACQYTIDRLKQIVPIWKKEFGEDGAVWVEGPQPASVEAQSAK